MIRGVTHFFRKLQWKFTFSHALITVVTFLFAEIIAFSLVFVVISQNISALFEVRVVQEAHQAEPFFVHGTPDNQEITAWLNELDTQTNDATTIPLLGDRPVFLVIVDSTSHLIASSGINPVSSSQMLYNSLSVQANKNLQSILTGGERNSLVSLEPDGATVVIVPIIGKNGQVAGSFIQKQTLPGNMRLFRALFSLIQGSLFVITPVVVVAGTIFGYFNAHGLTLRLKKLSSAADRWSQGDFSAPAVDRSDDELGQLTHQLNNMAEQLQNLLQARQKLATLEERNRLARDLHDSVKQQIFAVSMQLSTAKVLMGRDVPAAQKRLEEAEQLVHQAQQELTSLIRELRPAALDGKSLIVALRELVNQWSQQTGIVANLRTEGEQVLPFTIEEALFRVAQEALSNVARHSKATLVQLILTNRDKTNQTPIRVCLVGFCPTNHPQRGVGLLSMQERMNVLGGEIHIESAPGKGTKVVASCERTLARSVEKEVSL